MYFIFWNILHCFLNQIKLLKLEHLRNLKTFSKNLGFAAPILAVFGTTLVSFHLAFQSLKPVSSCASDSALAVYCAHKSYLLTCILTFNSFVARLHRCSMTLGLDFLSNIARFVNSQGNVGTCLSCGGKYYTRLVGNIILLLALKKIGQRLTNLAMQNWSLAGTFWKTAYIQCCVRKQNSQQEQYDHASTSITVLTRGNTSNTRSILRSRK